VGEQGAGAGDFGGVGAVVFGDLGFGGADVWGRGLAVCSWGLRNVGRVGVW